MNSSIKIKKTKSWGQEFHGHPTSNDKQTNKQKLVQLPKSADEGTKALEAKTCILSNLEKNKSNLWLRINLVKLTY